MADNDQRVRDAELSIRDRMLADLQSRVERLETALADHHAVTSKEGAIRDLQQKVYDQGQALRDAGVEFAVADRMLADLRSRAQELEAALAYERSRSAQLEAACRAVADREEIPTILEVTEPPWRRQIGQAIAEFEARFAREPAVLDWNSGLELAAAFPSATVFSPPEPAASTLPHLEHSVDVVVCLDTTAAVDEARRVASAMVVAISRSPTNDEGSRSQDVSTVGVRLEWVTSGHP